nr:zinc-regulated protein 8-like [Ipomoea batatas]GME16444.1 zinc-regulated protein 8-like [Ipomoea batatas]GME16481.1 zinc-regulated protein 8-like [Ipomoea batatas]
MQQKKQYLHELLREEQEPFQLNTYIADRRCENRRLPPPPKTSVQLKKCSATKRSLSPNGRVRLNVPARTAALLLDAALRIQKQQQQGEKKARPQIGLGLFGSILKRLKDRNRNKKREIKNDQRKGDDDNVVNEGVEVKKGNGEESLGVSYSRLSSAGWSESNEEKSLDLETSSSCRSEEIDEERIFCSSPLSPFRFSLERCESSGRRTPEFSSPAASPNLCRRQDKENCENGGMENGEQEEEDEKEQCSPVSVLDPPFEDDNYGVEEEDDEGHDDSDLECSYAIVQRAQQQLLSKLRRFEKLAELDPIELEKIMLEEEEDYEDNAAECDVDDHESFSSSRGDDDEDIERFASNGIIPLEIKRLVSDLISEEKTETNREVVWGRVCKRLDSWKEAKSETIDMMVELDLRTASCEWKSLREQVEETAMEIEVGIFGSLVDEFSGELMISGSLNKILT